MHKSEGVTKIYAEGVIPNSLGCAAMRRTPGLHDTLPPTLKGLHNPEYSETAVERFQRTSIQSSPSRGGAALTPGCRVKRLRRMLTKNSGQLRQHAELSQRRSDDSP